MLRVDLSDAATEELDDAYRWYEDQRPGLGDELLEEFLFALERVSANPLLYPIAHLEIRRAPLRRFPYSLMYRLEHGGLLIIAIFHARRDPRQWHART